MSKVFQLRGTAMVLLANLESNKTTAERLWNMMDSTSNKANLHQLLVAIVVDLHITMQYSNISQSFLLNLIHNLCDKFQNINFLSDTFITIC